MSDNKVWYLKQIDLFRGVPDNEITSIANKMIERQCAKKEVLYTPFEVTDSIYVLKRGEVTLYHLHRGKKFIIDVLKAGSIFGAFGLNEGEKNAHFAEVTEPAYVCIFQLDDFKKVLQAKPEIMLRLLKVISMRMGEYEQKLKGNVFDAKEKIIQVLGRLQRRKDINLIGKLMGKEGKITHEKLSQHTGLSRETVTRAINDLKKEGRIYDTPEGSLAVM